MVVKYHTNNFLEEKWIKEILSNLINMEKVECRYNNDIEPNDKIIITSYVGRICGSKLNDIEYFDGVVIQLSDEFHQLPIWVDKVSLILRNYAINTEKNNIFSFPLGPNANIPIQIPIKKFNERTIDFCFIGQWHNFSSSSPANISRTNMIKCLEFFLEKKYNVYYKMNETFFSKDISQDEYAQILNNSKFVLCPQGGSWETMRIWEVLRQGAIPIVQSPWTRPWFVDGWPALETSLWDTNFCNTMVNFLKNENNNKFNEIQEKCLDWWENKCSPAAISYKIKQQKPFIYNILGEILLRK